MTIIHDRDLKTLVCAAFPALEDNLFYATLIKRGSAYSNDQATYNIVLVLRDLISDDIQDQVSKFVGKIFNGSHDVNFVFQKGQLNPIELMRFIKINQPITLEGLIDVIGNKIFIPDGKFFENMLDHLRKENYIHWSKATKKYCLTERALNLVPHGKYRASSDIDRALVLGRKKW